MRYGRQYGRQTITHPTFINQGVDELDIEKLSTVLSAQYGSLHSAQEKLGTVSDIQSLFVSFQEKLYMENAG